MTKKRVCVIGNSHIGALKLAWDEGSPHSQFFEPIFFGSHFFQMDDLKFENGKFFAGSDVLARSMKKTSGLEEFYVQDYDAFVLVGLGFRFMPISYYKTHRLLADADDDFPPISPSCLAAVVAGMTKTDLLRRIAGQIRSVTNAPLLMAPVPHPCIEFLNAESVADDWMGYYREMVHSGLGAQLHPFFLTACKAIAAEFNAVFLNQPVKTITNEICSKAEYSQLMAPHGVPDFLHMNASYGHLVLGQMKRTLSKFEDAAESKPKLRRAG